jgi:hypothetical protein
LRAARAVFAAKKLVLAIAVHTLQKICERRETGVASAAVVDLGYMRALLRRNVLQDPWPKSLPIWNQR